MDTVSNIREEKRVAELQVEREATKRIEQKIEWCLSEVEKEKYSIREALDLNFFSVASSKIKRIETLKEKELELRAALVS